MLRSRAEIDAEPRVAQFVIERPCPIGHANRPDGLPQDELPLSIYVFLESRRPHSVCGEMSYKVYEMAAQSIDGTRRPIYKLREDSDVVRVCDHMGHIIE